MSLNNRPLLISITILLLVIVLVAVPATTYEVKATNLVFETVSKQTTYVGNQDPSAKIQVLTDPSSASNLDILPSDKYLVQSVDYSQYFVLAVSYGFGSSDQNDIAKVAQFKDTILVKSNFPTPSTDTDKTSPYQIIKIQTAQLSEFGDITFRLVNDVFVDKAKANQTFTR